MKPHVWLLMISLFACSRHSDPVGTYDFTSKPYIMISFHDQQEFILDSVYIQSFGFSPLEVNHIWAYSDYDGTYDLNLETGVWSRIEGTLAPYVAWLKDDHIHVDKYDPDLIWFQNNNLGLGLYDKGSDHLRKFQEIRSVSCILFDTADVWIGTSKGLYHFDRRNDSLAIVDAVAEIPIQQLFLQRPDRLNIDGRYVYDYDLDHLEKLDDIQGIIPLTVPYNNLSVVNDNNQYVTFKAEDGRSLYTLPYFSWKTILYEENTVWIPSNELYDGLVRIDVHGQSVDTFPIGFYLAVNQISADSRFVWMSNRSEAMAVNKQTGEAHYWSLPFGSLRNIVFQDSKYLYLQDRHSVVIIPMTKVMNESIPLANVKAEEELYNYLLDSTRISYIHEIRQWYKCYQRIHSAFKGTTSPRILGSLANIRAMTTYMAPDEYPPFDDALFSFVDSIDEPDVRAGFSQSLMVYAARKGKLDRAIELDNKLEKEFPVVDTNEYAGLQRMAMRRAYRALQDLAEKEIPDDERLWLTGNIYLRLFSHIGREREVGMDLEYPFSFFGELLRKYPTSSFADNADYLMSSNEFGLSHEGGQTRGNLEEIEGWKGFIRRYPDSEHIPEIYLQIAGLYQSYGYDDSAREKHLIAAKKYAEKIYKEYPGHSITAEVDQFLSYVDDELDKMQWKLTIKSVKERYEKKEPVLISYTLTNGGDKPKTIKIYADSHLSNFTLYVTETGRYIMQDIHPQKMLSDLRDTTILPGHEYAETKDITKWVKVKNFGTQGFYKMDEYGEYTIQAFFELNSYRVASNEIKFWRN